MKNKLFYLKLVILVLIVSNGVCFYEFLEQEDAINMCFLEDNSSYVLVEKNIIDKSFISYLYKNNDDEYLGKIYEYDTNEEIGLENILNKDKIEEYNDKIKELIYLKYPKFIADELIKENVEKSYVFRDNELVIYFNGYNIEPQINEVLYLKINYNLIKEYLDFTVVLDSEYEIESGYKYTNLKKSVAITFDDSPNKNKTNKILEYLNDNHFHATFFVVGEKALYNKDLLVSIKNSGNEIGGHSFYHQNYSKLTDEEFILDYDKMNDLYKSLFNENLKLIRPPYGIINSSQQKLVPVSFIMWNLDTNDWRYKNSNYLVNYVVNNIKDGDIILFHDSYNSTVLAIEKLLPILYSMGYQVMSVSELFQLKGITIEENNIYYNGL